MGEGQEREFEGFQARIIQHEIDHLNGVTLLGRAGTAKRRSYMKKINKVRKSMDKLRK
jgi:peptide deformylase